MSTMIEALPSGAARVRGRRRSRVAYLKFGLAGLALLGIGAAATSAAWSDDAWFLADTSGATVELAGSTTAAGAFVEADTDATGVQITVAGFTNLVPGDTRTATLYLKNASTVPLTIALDASTTNGLGVFAGANPATVTVTGAPATLTAGATSGPVTVTVAAPATWPTTYQGADAGAVRLRFSGSTGA